MYQSLNPFTEDIFFTANTFSDSEIETCITQASSSFSNFKNTSFDERRAILKKLADGLLINKESLAKTMCIEMGKPITQANAEIEKCISVCIYYMENGETFLAQQNYDSSFSKSFVVHEPLGVILAIMPWNFPFWQVFRFLAPAIICGNICLLKHAPNVPQCALAIESLVENAFDTQLLYNLFATNEQVKKIIASDTVKAITLTGSDTAGSAVASIAGKHIKKCVLELGGSDPFIVLPDADIEKTIEGAILGRFLNAGQSCIASKRLIVHHDIHSTFIEEFKIAISKLPMGDPLNPKTFFGPMARLDLRDKLTEQIILSKEKGAAITSIGATPRQGYFLAPTLVENINCSSPAYTDELFGPVASILTYTNLEDALHLANDTQYGLGASIWTSNPDQAISMARRINAGAVFINDFVKSAPSLPFGGINKSGYGRELSDLGMKEFVNTKTIVLG